MIRRLLAIAVAATCLLLTAHAPASAEPRWWDQDTGLKPEVMHHTYAGPEGRLMWVRPLKRSLWVPGITERAYRISYITKNSYGQFAPSTGAVFIPRGAPPAGGWPVISWGHGTAGLADHCAPSVRGPADPDRDDPYLRTWMKQGYAILASDYVGLGSDGPHAYLDARATAYAVTDIVKAALAMNRRWLSTSPVSNRWAALGQSQGGAAAITTARWGQEIGGDDLDFRGSVATGGAGFVETIMWLPGPMVPPVSIGDGMAGYLAAFLAGLNNIHPELHIPSALTSEGKKFVRFGDQMCDTEIMPKLKGTVIGDWFTKPLASLPGYVQTVEEYAGMPTSGFTKPLFMGNGLADTDVWPPFYLAYEAALTASGADLTARYYPGDHSATMDLSLKDTIPFMARLFQN